MIKGDEVFSKVLDSLRTKVSDFNYKNWFQLSSWGFEEPDKVVIRVPSRFIRDWLQEHYLELIKFELFRHTEKEFIILFKVDRHIDRNMPLFPEGSIVQTATEENPEKSVDTFIQQARLQTKKTFPERQILGPTLGFNTKYTFENFVVGNSNQFVSAACKAVAMQPAKSYNPLFIYGGVGLGKTHLLNAIGIEVMKTYPNMRIIYVTGESFTNEIISAIRQDKTFEFRKKYRNNCDMLLIDDIQIIAGKESTMQEFFHTFNALFEGRKQIILTSDKLPQDIPNLEERIHSRFSWGLLADIQPPDYETRIAILQFKAEQEGIILPQDVCEFIATHVTSNVRNLEGSLIRIFAFASLSKVEVTLELAQEVLQNLVGDIKPKLSVESIQSKVSDYYNLKISDLKSKRRHKNLAFPRQVAMYLCKTHLQVSFPELGQRFGGKDHSTVIHAVQKIRKHLEINPNTQADVNSLEKSLGI